MKSVWMFWITLLLVFSSCNDYSKSKDMVVVGNNQLFDKRVSFQFAIYLSTYDLPLSNSIISFGNAEFKDLHFGDNSTGSINFSSVKVITDVQTSYAPPNEESLQYFGRGISDSDVGKILNCKNAIIVTFNLENSKDFALQRQATRFIYDLSQLYDGYIWDEECRIICTPKYWHDNVAVISEVNNPILMAKNTVIHQYQEGELIRSISLGMKKFGLPDIAVREASRHDSKSVANIINIVEQHLSENPNINMNGSTNIELSLLRETKFKTDQMQGLFENGTGKGEIFFEIAQAEDGDPNNRIWNLKFIDFSSDKFAEKQSKFFSDFFGSKDEVINVQHDGELLKASEAAKKQLPRIQEMFNNGKLKPGELLMVKAPFKYINGTEWMWVEVLKWNGNNISGILQNDPDFVNSLKSGQRVDVNQDQLFDYLIYFKDGTTEGNETGRILEKMQE